MAELTIGTIDHSEPLPYGDTTTYELGAEFLSDCSTVEDWGCGRGWMRQYIQGQYWGVDIGVDSLPSFNPFADEIDDLTHHLALGVDGVFIRHVLEHNWQWEQILLNALDSAFRKVCIVIFTPWSTTGEHEIICTHGPPLYPEPVPNISFDREKFLSFLPHPEVIELETDTQYSVEHLIRVVL